MIAAVSRAALNLPLEGRSKARSAFGRGAARLLPNRRMAFKARPLPETGLAGFDPPSRGGLSVPGLSSLWSGGTS